MRKLLSSKDAEFISNVYQLLGQHGIPVSVNEQGDDLELWVHQRSYEAAAKQLIADYKANPEAFKPLPTTPSSTQRSNLTNGLLKNTGWLTRVLAGLTVLLYLLLQMDPVSVLDAFRISHSYSELPTQQPWRFITPVLLHFSLMHLVFNVFWWWYLGGRIERYLGTPWLLAVFLFSGIVANIAQYMVSGPNFGGLSGVVYGLLGFCWLYSMGRPTFLRLPPGLIVFMIGWLLLGYTGVLWVNIANEAHLAGLLAGCLAGVLVRFLNPRPQLTD